MSVTAFLPIIGKVIDQIFPDKEAADKAKLEMAKLQQEGQFKEIELAFDAIVAEAKSSDPYTSRARPSFLYVMYIMILGSFPMGVLYAFKPEVASQVATGVTFWLNAIPQEMYYLFGTGYLGYAGSRSWEKGKGVTK